MRGQDACIVILSIECRQDRVKVNFSNDGFDASQATSLFPCSIQTAHHSSPRKYQMPVVHISGATEIFSCASGHSPLSPNSASPHFAIPAMTSSFLQTWPQSHFAASSSTPSHSEGD